MSAPAARGIGYNDVDTRQAIDGTIGIKPVELAIQQPAHPWGELDGVFWCSGFGGNGADDIDGTIDDTTRIYSMAGAEDRKPSMSIDDMHRIVRAAGYRAVERDTFYNEI